MNKICTLDDLCLILYINLQIQSQNPQDPTKLKEIQFDSEDVPAVVVEHTSFQKGQYVYVNRLLNQALTWYEIFSVRIYFAQTIIIQHYCVAVYRHFSHQNLVALYNCIVTVDVSDRGIICNACSRCIDLVSLKQVYILRLRVLLHLVQQFMITFCFTMYQYSPILHGQKVVSDNTSCTSTLFHTK